MHDTKPRKERSIGTVIALIILFAVPLTAVLIPTPTEARSYSSRLEQINEEIKDLVARLKDLYAERREILANGEDEGYPGYVDPRLGQVKATVYTNNSSKQTKIEAYYDRRKHTLYTTATTRQAIVRAVARHFDVSERAVERVLTITYERRSYDYDDDDWDWQRDNDYSNSSYYDGEDEDYTSSNGGRWWGDSTHDSMSDEELAREKETWWDNDGY